MNNKNLMQSNDVKWMNSKEAAEYMRISTASLRNMVSNGKLPFYKLGRRLRFIESELKNAILSQKFGLKIDGE